jgi:RND superfamily putative drug exporter
MNRFFARLGSSVVRYRYLVVAAWIAVAVVASITLPSLGSEVNNDNSQFLPASAPSEQAATLAQPILGKAGVNSQVLVVASTASGTLTSADQAAIAKAQAAIAHDPRVVAAKETAIAPDDRAAIVSVTLHVNVDDIQTQERALAALSRTLAASGAPSGLSFHLAGAIATNVANQSSSAKTGNEVQGLSFLLIIVLLLIIFRAPLAAVATLLPPGFALVIAMRFIGGLGANGLKISEITELLLIVLLLGAGTDYGLFLVFRVREAMLNGQEPKDAVAYAMTRVGESISASAGTVILALLTLLFASFGIYRDLGVPLALGMAVMLLAGLTLLPALLAIFGHAAFWPSRVKKAHPARHGWWGRIAARLVAKPAATLAIGIVVFLGLSSAAIGYHSSGFGGATAAPKGSDAAIGNALLAENFPKSSANPANLVFRYPEPVWDHPSAIQAAERSLQASGQFTQLAGPLDPNGTALTPSEYASLHARLGDPTHLPALEPASAGVPTALYNAYRSTALFVGPGGHTIQFEANLKAGPQSTTAALNATPTIRALVARAAHASGASANGVAGEAAALYDVSSTSNHDLIHIIPIAILAIGILLAAVLRSLVAPLYLVVSVGLSYLAALGFSTLVFTDIGHAKGLTFILPFLMFIFLLALGEDYNILVMTRIREEVHDRPLREAVAEAVGRTGPTITSAGIVLAGTFLTLVVASSGPGSSQIRDIGFGLAFGILMDTFFVRTLLVPSTVALLGRRNWWPSKLGRASHAPDQPPEPDLVASASPSEP